MFTYLTYLLLQVEGRQFFCSMGPSFLRLMLVEWYCWFTPIYFRNKPSLGDAP